MKFKAGDRVVTTGAHDSNGACVDAGVIAHVTSIGSDGIALKQETEGSLHWSSYARFEEQEIDPVETPTRAFQVGDRVRVVDTTSWMHGKTGTVAGGAGKITVDLDNPTGGTVYRMADSLELVEAAPENWVNGVLDEAHRNSARTAVDEGPKRLAAESAMWQERAERLGYELRGERAKGDSLFSEKLEIAKAREHARADVDRLSTENAELQATLNSWTTGAEATKLREILAKTESELDSWVEVAEERRLLIESMHIGRDRRIAEAVAAEREACARQIQAWWTEGRGDGLAAIVRARGPAPPVVDRDAGLAAEQKAHNDTRIKRNDALAAANRYAARVGELEARLAKVREIVKG